MNLGNYSEVHHDLILILLHLQVLYFQINLYLQVPGLRSSKYLLWEEGGGRHNLTYKADWEISWHCMTHDLPHMYVKSPNLYYLSSERIANVSDSHKKSFQTCWIPRASKKAKERFFPSGIHTTQYETTTEKQKQDQTKHNHQKSHHERSTIRNNQLTQWTNKMQEEHV